MDRKPVEGSTIGTFDILLFLHNVMPHEVLNLLI